MIFDLLPLLCSTALTLTTPFLPSLCYIIFKQPYDTKKNIYTIAKKGKKTVKDSYKTSKLKVKLSEMMSCPI